MTLFKQTGRICAALLLSVYGLVATADVDRTVLPIPEPEFKGKITPFYQGSVGEFPQPIAAPKDAPNVLLILLDDVGFGQPSVNGGLP